MPNPVLRIYNRHICKYFADDIFKASLSSFFFTQLNRFKYYNVKKVKLATLVEGVQKAPFSIATTPRVLLLSRDCSTLPLIRTLHC